MWSIQEIISAFRLRVQSEVFIKELGMCLWRDLSLEHIIMRKLIPNGLPEAVHAFQLFCAYCAEKSMRISPCIIIY